MHLKRSLSLIAAVACTLGIALPKVHAETQKTETATFGGGCYWCVEAVFQRLKGVDDVSPGFMGGHLANPSYKQVLTGRTGHVEVVQIKFDPAVITFDELLEVFWATHDPTTPNRQGPDIGPQYRSVVFCHTKEQKAIVTKYKKQLNRERVYPSAVVTSIEDASEFYPAAEDHRNYYNNNPEKQYCRVMIGPKLKKLKQIFSDRLKPEDRTSK